MSLWDLTEPKVQPVYIANETKDEYYPALANLSVLDDTKAGGALVCGLGAVLQRRPIDPAVLT